MKVAIYARYSSDNQRDASIADQFRICREFAGRQGWTVVQEFTDQLQKSSASAASLPLARAGRSSRNPPITRSPAPRCFAPASRR